MNIYQRLSAISSEIATVPKNLNVSTGKTSYKAVAESDVLVAVKKLEKQYGVYSYPIKREIVESNVFTKTSNGAETSKLFMRIKTTYRFVNIDEPSEFIEIDTYGDGVDTQDKAPGKAMTYADKYALLKAYKVATGDDPDGEGSQDMGKQTVNPDVPTVVQLNELKRNNRSLANVAKMFTKSEQAVTKADVDVYLKKFEDYKQEKQQQIDKEANDIFDGGKL